MRIDAFGLHLRNHPVKEPSHMRTLPVVTDPLESGAVIIRTDYQNEEAWQLVVAEIDQPWGGVDAHEPVFTIVNDPAWAGATVDEIREVASSDEELSVVFIVDRLAVHSDNHALLAVNTSNWEDDEYGADAIERDREFRTTPAGVHHVQANLAVGNLAFQEYADWAQEFPEGILRPE
ncbi:hypothetical protein [Streptomyces sp. NPDC048349]|uniref:DUF6924 domain-containing protein n=1 Tax=Streptomyces sp. NPDC048349 TaxID=3155486 RepID=UPI00341421A0